MSEHSSFQLDQQRIARYIGADQAQALWQGSLRPHELYAICARLANAQYVLTTYSPRRLVAHRLTTTDNQPWVEWVDGSLLFADISGSTALAERLSGIGREGIEIVTDTLNTYFGALIRRIQRAGGDLITFGGDALLVLFTDPDHAYTATSVAYDLQQSQANFVREVPGIGSFPLTMHIGVESGRIALVSAGRPESLRYSAMGACVERVARAEELGGRGEIVVGPQAWSALAGRAQGEPLADGYVKIHAVAGQSTISTAPTHYELPSPSRETALHLLWTIERLSPYLPAILVDRILDDPQRPHLEADLRPVSILFAQIEGLTSLVEDLPPQTIAYIY